MIVASTFPGGAEPPSHGAPRVVEADVLALWRQAFDAARVVADEGTPSVGGESTPRRAHEHESGRRRGDRQSAALDEHGTPGDRDRGASETRADAAGRSEGPRAPAHRDTAEAADGKAVAFPGATARAPAATVDEATADRAASGTAPPISARSGATGRCTEESVSAQAAVERASSPPAAAERLLPRRTEAAQRPPAAARPQRLPDAPETLPPAESVRVFQDARGLQVVVRHVGLAPQSAVWCALETARQLTGDRRALQQVLLNGRSVYESSSTERSSRPAAAAVVLFTC